MGTIHRFCCLCRRPARCFSLRAKRRLIPKKQLLDSLGEAAEGRYSERAMSPKLQYTCGTQMPAMGSSLRKKGANFGATYRGQQQVPGGMAEV
jgi:hypothetical protein